MLALQTHCLNLARSDFTVNTRSATLSLGVSAVFIRLIKRLVTPANLQEQQRKGVIVAADCNFSMAVAHHAVELKIPVFVIMPSCCSSGRLRTYRDYGAMVISYGGTARDSQKHAGHLARENGYLFLEESVLAHFICNIVWQRNGGVDG